MRLAILLLSLLIGTSSWGSEKITFGQRCWLLARFAKAAASVNPLRFATNLLSGSPALMRIYSTDSYRKPYGYRTFQDTENPDFHDRVLVSSLSKLGYEGVVDPQRVNEALEKVLGNPSASLKEVDAAVEIMQEAPFPLIDLNGKIRRLIKNQRPPGGWSGVIPMLYDTDVSTKDALEILQAIGRNPSAAKIHQGLNFFTGASGMLPDLSVFRPELAPAIPGLLKEYAENPSVGVTQLPYVTSGLLDFVRQNYLYNPAVLKTVDVSPALEAIETKLRFFQQNRNSFSKDENRAVDFVTKTVNERLQNVRFLLSRFSS